MTRPARAQHLLQLFEIRRAQGRVAEIVDAAREIVQMYPGLPNWRCLLALLFAELDDLPTARAEFEAVFGNGIVNLPRDSYWLASVVALAEVATRLRDEPAARSLYDILLPFDGRLVSPGTNAVCFGPVSFCLGRLAMATGERDAAIRHYRDAEGISERIGMKSALAWTRFHHAELLSLHSDSDSDAESLALARSAHDMAQECQMRVLSQRAAVLVTEIMKRRGR